MKPTHALATTALLGAVLAGPAIAGDPCLVGTWEPQGNGAAEWVQRQAPGMKMAVTRQAGSIQFGADGAYRLSAQVQAAAAGRDGIQARSTGKFAAQGRWSTAGGNLTLTPSASDIDGRTELSGKGGRMSMRMPDTGSRPTTQAYTCSGGELETRMQVPGVADPIVQRYRRQ